VKQLTGSFDNKKIAEFEKNYPNIKVELTKLTWQRGNEKLKIAAIGGIRPILRRELFLYCL
jgi:ABC-type glycerol-3-phosphate transport system substrate-binding protein